MTNPAMPGLVKIGRTSTNPDERAAALRTTGVPARFVVEHSVLSWDHISLERELHSYFSSSRHSDEREFFRISPQEAIEAFSRFSQLLESNLTDLTTVCLYAYRVRGKLLNSRTDEAVKCSRYKQMPEFDEQAWAGLIRVGCLLEEARRIEGSGFSIAVGTGQYLSSEAFRSNLSDYYEELTGRVQVIRPVAFLLHCRDYKVSKVFFEDFVNSLRSTFLESKVTPRMYDDQTFNSEQEPYEVFLNYENLSMLFGFESMSSVDTNSGSSAGLLNSASIKAKYKNLL